MTSSTPAWGLDSVVLRLDDAPVIEAPTPEWAFGSSTGAGVRVAVVDSGIEADHPALEGCVDVDGGIDVQVDRDGTIVLAPGAHGDVFGHGTACAGIIHALAPEASITSVRVLGPDLTGRAAAFHAGLAWAVDQGFDVINLSLGTTKAEWALAFHEVCDRAYFAGSFVVTAANNTRRVSYPSLFASVASVACTTSRDPLRFHANPAPPTEFLARGIDVEVPWLGGTTTTSTGNSYAAPHIAGLAALIKGAHPDLRPFQVKDLLWTSAANVREARAHGRPVQVAERAGREVAAEAPGTTAAMTRVVRLPTAADMAAAAPDAAAPARSAATAPTWRVGDYEAVGRARRSPWAILVPARRGDQEVVLHDLRPVLGAEPDTTVALLEAVRAAAAVGHPHIEPVVDLVQDHGVVVVTAQPRATGPELIADMPLPLADALAVSFAVLSGLEALHRRGLVHGDVRLDGLVVDGAGRARVGWSGVAAAVGRPPLDPGRPPPALAPEVLAGQRPDARTDVHQAALLLTTLVGGGAPDALVTAAAALPGDLGPAVAAAAAPDPASRPADATTLARVLTWAADEAVGMDGVLASPFWRGGS